MKEKGKRSGRMTDERKRQLLRLLDMAQREVENGQEISTEYARIFFPPQRREYELTYYGQGSRSSARLTRRPFRRTGGSEDRERTAGTIN